MGRKSREKARRRADRRAHNNPTYHPVRLVPDDGAGRSTRPVSTFGGWELFSSLSGIFFSHAHEIEEEWKPVFGYPYCIELEQPLKCGLRVRFPSMDLFSNLGRTCKVEVQGQEAWVIIPRPSVAIEMLERLRLVALALLRASENGHKSFRAAWAEPAVPAELAGLEALGVPVVEYLLHLGTTQEGGLEAPINHERIAAWVVIANLFTVWCRERYDLKVIDHESWVRGRSAESALLCSRLAPREVWPKAVQELVSELELGAPSLGRFVPRDRLPEDEEPTGGDGAARRRRQSVWNPERLLFYMGLPEYLEPRAIETGDRFGYIAVTFRGNRVGLDTAKTNNRFFGLEGELEECLRLARLTKREIRASSLCKLPLVHDSDGTWQTKVKQWLRGELDRT